jgi:hypothetical protein
MVEAMSGVGPRHPAPEHRRPPHGPEPLIDREHRQPWLFWAVHLGLPTFASLLLHLALVVILALNTWEMLERREFPAGEFEAGIMDAHDTDASGALSWPSSNLLPPGVLTLPEAPGHFDASELMNPTIPIPAVRTAGTGGEEGGGFGLGGVGRSGVLGIGEGGAGEGGGAGFGSGFGSGGGSGSASVWGLSVAGHRFVYVVDFSGSIVVAVDDLKRELKRSVGRLKPSQMFNVVLFYGTTGKTGQSVTESFASELQPARSEVKSRFFQWIDKKAPTGATEPLAAVQRAIRLKPEVIFLFSDGYFDDKIVKEIEQANRSARCRIHCLVFDELLLQVPAGHLPPRLTDGARRLKRIAEANGGRFKVVTSEDFRRR